MKITYYGHSCFLIKAEQKSFLIDPFISHNPLASQVDIDSIACDHILITHGHLDHVADVERIAKNTGAQLVSNYEIISWYQDKGIEGHGMNHGGWWYYPGGRIKYVQAVHSSVLPDGTYGGNPGGFVIEDASATIYISGDTALTMDMNLIPLMCKPLDAAILCIGDNFTMGIEDAVLAATFVACDTIIGAHYDTFAPIKIDHQKAHEAFSSKDKRLHLLEIEESIDV